MTGTGRSECACFLAWAFPRLGLDPRGYRRVRRQACKRIRRRLKELGLTNLERYRARLAAEPDEWDVLARCCHITISRFYRDRRVFDFIASTIMPELADAARRAGRSELRVWSAGCASGEEPYTISLLWHLAPSERYQGLSLAIVATDADEAVLGRARNGLYREGSLAELPRGWIDSGFLREGPLLRLRPEYRRGILFIRQDLRSDAPDGPFDLVLCRNLAFTYFDEPGRRRVLERISGRLRPGGALVIGKGERLPADGGEIEPWVAELGIFRRRRAGHRARGLPPPREAKSTGAHPAPDRCLALSPPVDVGHGETTCRAPNVSCLDSHRRQAAGGGVTCW